MRPATNIERKEFKAIVDKLRESNYLLADLLAKTIVDDDWHRISQLFYAVDSAIQKFESEDVA
jgi:hypothetical protein